MSRLAHRTAALAGLTALVSSLSFAGTIAPAQASEPVASRAATCLDPADLGAGTGDAAAARGGRSGSDHRELSAQERAAIEKRTKEILADKRKPGGGGTTPTAGGGVPVYVHVMADANGNGNVTDTQITQQIAELNQDFAGGESTSAANTGFTFSLAGVDRYYNTQWHQDKSSTTYRSQTRLGGKNALNIWLVDFAYLGIATFPWDYARNPGIDGIRVQLHLAARWLGHQLQPGQDRLARGRPLVRALPHVPGRLHDHERRGERHPRAEQRHQRLPRGPRLLLAGRARPDPQLHGLQLRPLLQPVHPEPGHPDAADVLRVPLLTPDTRGGLRTARDTGGPSSRGPSRRADPPHARCEHLEWGGSSRARAQSSGTPGNSSGCRRR